MPGMWAENKKETVPLPGHPGVERREVHITAIQKQCPLTYLGYDTGVVDGICGDKSRQADMAAALDTIYSGVTE